MTKSIVTFFTIIHLIMHTYLNMEQLPCYVKSWSHDPISGCIIHVVVISNTGSSSYQRRQQGRTITEEGGISTWGWDLPLKILWGVDSHKYDFSAPSSPRHAWFVGPRCSPNRRELID